MSWPSLNCPSPAPLPARHYVSHLHGRSFRQAHGYYSYNDHTDVETVIDSTGDTRATYGYTAYGKGEDAETTGIDKPDPQDPTKEPYNPYRFNAKRWDAASEPTIWGFRNYAPGLNRFLSRDMYNGAVADMDLNTDPITGNRYSFGGGNPVGNVEIDGHRPADCHGECWKNYLETMNRNLRKDLPYPAHNTSRHHRARDAAASVLRLQELVKTGDFSAMSNVRTECPILGASKKGTGNPGAADICYRAGSTLPDLALRDRAVDDNLTE